MCVCVSTEEAETAAKKQVILAGSQKRRTRRPSIHGTSWNWLRKTIDIYLDFTTYIPRPWMSLSLSRSKQRRDTKGRNQRTEQTSKSILDHSWCP